MAQADSVPSSSRQLITVESANQSTNLQPVNLPAVSVKLANRRYLTGVSHARVIIGSEEAPLLRLRREKRGDEPEDLLKCRSPMGSNIETFFYANAAFFLRRLLRRIVRILLLFVSRNKRLRDSALEKASSNQLIPSRPQGRLR